MAEAVAGRSFKRVTSSPKTAAVVATLESLAADLDVAACNRKHFVNGLGEAVFRVCAGTPTPSSPANKSSVRSKVVGKLMPCVVGFLRV